MEKTRALISAHQESHKEFKYYFSVIEIAEDSINDKPDVTIDCCKSLIEGVSKSILIRLDNNYARNNELVDKVKADKLFDKAIKLISKYDKSLIGKEVEFLNKSRELVDTIIKIRNDRGDISHGKFTPKPDQIISTSEFALFIVNLTDSIISFMLKVFYEIKISLSEKIDYESKKMEDYNNWLDDSVDFPIKKARYSQLLFENDYDEYESRYSDEFLKSFEIEEDSEIAEGILVATKPEVAPEITKVEAAIPTGKKIEAPSALEIKEVETLVNTFQEETFWTGGRTENLQAFASTKNLKSDQLKKLVSEFLFTEKAPLRDDVVDAMQKKPSLRERGKIAAELITEIITFAKNLSSPEAAV